VKAACERRRTRIRIFLIRPQIFLPSSDYASADAVVFVYDISNKLTLEHATMAQKGWTDHLSVFPSSIPIFLVGNKIDLRQKSRTEEGDDFVSEEEGQEAAKSRGWTFLETSALDSHNISDLFSKIAQATLERIQNNSNPSTVAIKKEG
jgi:GTPase SAR1 family protein